MNLRPKQHLSSLLFILFSFCSKADTLDFYHVFYNQELIAKYSLISTKSESVLHFDSSLVEQGDSLNIKYWEGCTRVLGPRYIIAHNKTTQEAIYTIVISGYNFFNFSLEELLSYSKQSSCAAIYFSYGLKQDEEESVYLFEIKFI